LPKLDDLYNINKPEIMSKKNTRTKLQISSVSFLDALKPKISQVKKSLKSKSELNNSIQGQLLAN